jgi:hypothetical protein
VKKVSKLCSIVFLVVLLATVCLSVYAEINVSVTIRDPTNSSNQAKGVILSGYWIGEIPVMVDSSTIHAQQTKAYCMNYEKTIYIGSTYSAKIAPVTDNAAWRAISYILTWSNPPVDNNAAAVNQVAIWKLLSSGYSKPSWLTTSINTDGINLAGVASGKDVVRQGDDLTWIAPKTGDNIAMTGKPNDVINLQVKLTTSANAPRPNVKIIFAATRMPANTALDSPYLSNVEAFTNSNGEAVVSVKLPPDMKSGESIQLKASTKSVWPQLYLDLTDNARQDLIGIDTAFQLTVCTNVCVIAQINIIPEVPLGTLTAGLACAFAFVIYTKGGKLKRQKGL